MKTNTNQTGSEFVLTGSCWTTWRAGRCCSCWTWRLENNLWEPPSSDSERRRTWASPCADASESVYWCIHCHS